MIGDLIWILYSYFVDSVLSYNCVLVWCSHVRSEVLLRFKLGEESEKHPLFSLFLLYVVLPKILRPMTATYMSRIDALLWKYK